MTTTTFFFVLECLLSITIEMFSKQFLIRFPNNNNIISRSREIAEKEEDEDMCDKAHSWGNFHGMLRAERDGKRKDMKSHSGKNGCQN